eukprot:TRINITY_DN5_c0_g1_i2.p3 TRINITY_DN5_c0_g1~~TRINITY_DN5_c0_g1_i2.p3  ORF type:complete len:127 (-),score=18.61 TRINITY_DN5_c0_g1_i2:112-492(-)
MQTPTTATVVVVCAILFSCLVAVTAAARQEPYCRPSNYTTLVQKACATSNCSEPQCTQSNFTVGACVRSGVDSLMYCCPGKGDGPFATFTVYGDDTECSDLGTTEALPLNRCSQEAPDKYTSYLCL